jgi:glycine/D-amino acid oxidase-like deaminating enzyme
MVMPAREQSLWRVSYTESLYPPLTGDTQADVCIIGAGVTGLTAAYLLKRSGLKVVVLEKDTVGAGTTGRTTGKITSQHNLIYADLAKRLGKKTARFYGAANQAAVSQVATIIDRQRIDCDFERDDNYVYTADIKQLARFRHEARTAAGLGLPASFETKLPLPFTVRGAVRFTDQGKLNSQKYLLGLARAVDGDGSSVHENSNVIGIRDGTPGRVRTGRASVQAKNIIVSTNVPTLPLMARGLYCLLEYPTESYIVAGALPGQLKGMYISPDEGHYSILPIVSSGRRHLLVGGASHISGLRGNKAARYRRLAAYAHEHFDVDVSYRWSDRDYSAYDGIPLVGRLYPWSKHLYVATAFNKWGLSNGTVAAMILHDLLTEQKAEWAAVFDSVRRGPLVSIPRVAAQYMTGRH